MPMKWGEITHDQVYSLNREQLVRGRIALDLSADDSYTESTLKSMTWSYAKNPGRRDKDIQSEVLNAFGIAEPAASARPARTTLTRKPRAVVPIPEPVPVPAPRTRRPRKQRVDGEPPAPPVDINGEGELPNLPPTKEEWRMHAILDIKEALRDGRNTMQTGDPAEQLERLIGFCSELIHLEDPKLSDLFHLVVSDHHRRLRYLRGQANIQIGDLINMTLNWDEKERSNG